MRRLRLALALALLGCTTSFETTSLRARDAGASDAGPDVIAADRSDVDAPAGDAPEADLPAADVPADARDVADGAACGVAGRPCCAAAASACVGDTVCNEGMCVACPANTVACASACVDLRTSLRHCGRCGGACAEGQSCVGGTCTLVCPTSLNACGDRCVDLAHNASHCGRCDEACVGGAVCEGGACIVSCSPGQTVCAGGCVNTQSDASHCGGCGRACALPNAVARCAAGACGVAACDAGFGDCDNDPANGCETSLSSLTSCGRCGQRCEVTAGSAACVEGRCSVGACSEGFGDCDANPANGCETDLRRDPRNCRSCGFVCVSATGVATCTNGECGSSSVVCPANRAECGGVDPTDCEADLRSPLSCGRCGNVCALPNAENGCSGGSCTVARCMPGYGDCDSTAANGCEVDLNNSASHCGACGRACALPHAVPRCARGGCAIASCEQGFADCDGDAANGCEVDLRASVTNCGACGSRCPTANSTAACVEGQCAVGACSPGYSNCDGNVSNGCEVRTSQDVANCGTCQNACVLPNATPECSSGACRVQRCADDFANCDGSASNGCEVDLRTSVQHCGGCDQRCVVANGTGACVARSCAVGACNSGFADCDNRPGNGCETSLNTNANCGGCGRACAMGTMCTGGQCTSTCAAGTVLCGGACVDTSSSASHCGGCGAACPGRPNAVATCAAGRCGIACNAGFGDCDGDPGNGCETRLDTLSNCGRCGVACANAPNAVGYCSGGACQLTCQGTFRNCDGDATNGCEVNVASDPGNCGGCLNRCPRRPNSLPVCRQGACGIECNFGWGDCLQTAPGCETNLLGLSYRCGSCIGVCIDRTCRGGVCTRCSGTETTSCPDSVISGQDGCGIDLRTDVRHCGACGQVCPASGTRLNHATYTGSCANSACQLACEGTWRDCDGNWQNGCEVNVACDRERCGACGTQCASASVCCGGTCQPASAPSCNLSAPGCR
ncbi:MAG: hypothetical protein R3A48_02030 [Polyangiales bacterium]